MKETHIRMGMPITVEIVEQAKAADFDTVFAYFHQVDARFSTYKKDSEISQVNRGLPEAQWSEEMKLVLGLCEETKRQTNGYFDCVHNGHLDPSGLVKGWAVLGAADLLARAGYHNFYVEAGGDIEARGHNAAEQPWDVGIRNPFSTNEIMKVVRVSNRGVATSGTYIRGEHVYNPHDPTDTVSAIKSLTVIGPNVYEADRFATAAFAMGEKGIAFIEQLPGFEGYMVDDTHTATYTSAWEDYVATPA